MIKYQIVKMEPFKHPSDPNAMTLFFSDGKRAHLPSEWMALNIPHINDWFVVNEGTVTIERAIP